MKTERHEDGRPRSWDWLLVCATGAASGSWDGCHGELERSGPEMGATLHCEAHRGLTVTATHPGAPGDVLLSPKDGDRLTVEMPGGTLTLVADPGVPPGTCLMRLPREGLSPKRKEWPLGELAEDLRGPIPEDLRRLGPDPVAALNRPRSGWTQPIPADISQLEDAGPAVRPSGYAADQSDIEPVEHKHGALEEKIWQVLARAQEQLADIGALETCEMTVRLPKAFCTQIGLTNYAHRVRGLAHGAVRIQEDPSPPFLAPEDT